MVKGVVKVSSELVKFLITEQFSETASSITSFKVDSDVVSLHGDTSSGEKEFIGVQGCSLLQGCSMFSGFLVEEIDVSKAKLRQVVSALAKYCSPYELTNRLVALTKNVKPGKLRNATSQGLSTGDTDPAKAKASKPTGKEVAEKENELSVSLLNIHVGLIRKAWNHPTADSFLVEEIDVSKAKLRQVVSALAKYSSPDELTLM
ncbi:uncharacterized protein LOC131645242 [Vicia villosa]|uniref:uncharacterized protein LOC131645242 n=1 Tax=Vicia villosa TaxID=3911 RepID=UPI00273B4FBB|nr:uncharacterized protein LOC131645242 [Vicia villosa]